MKKIQAIFTKKLLWGINMDNINVSQVNLDDKENREHFSNNLKDMEKEFSYPLGNNYFFIKHGYNSQYDYFSFFEQFGKPYFFVIEKNNKTIGSICFVLREINNKKVWYICDLKIIQEEQSKKIAFILYNLLKDKLNNICNSFYFVNMSPMKNNALFKIADKVLQGFKMDIKPLYFYEVKKDNIHIQDKVILTNDSKKDIVINDISQKLYHAVDNKVIKRCSDIIIKDITRLTEEDNIMFCSFEELEGINYSTIGIFVSNGLDKVESLSSFEI